MAKLDYTKMRFNPKGVPKGAMVGEHYLPLSRRAFFTSVPDGKFIDRGEKEIPTKMDLHLLVSFTILFCDKGSPYYRERDFEERKALCMEDMGIGRDSLVGRCIIEDHWWFGGVLTAYLRFTEPGFDTWITLTISNEQNKAYMRRPLPEKGLNDALDLREKIRKGLKSADADILEIEERIFVDRQTRDVVIEAATSDGMAGWAEKFALEYPN